MKGRHSLDCFIYLQHCQIGDHLERKEGAGGMRDCAGILIGDFSWQSLRLLATCFRSLCVLLCVKWSTFSL